MSVCKNYYVIVGYDLTGFETDKFEDWKWTTDGEEYHNNQIKGEIQLFDDPMCGNHLYFGYILAAGDQYSCETTEFTVHDAEKQMTHVTDELFYLIDIGVISKDLDLKFIPKIIAFEECI